MRSNKLGRYRYLTVPKNREAYLWWCLHTVVILFNISQFYFYLISSMMSGRQLCLRRIFSILHLENVFTIYSEIPVPVSINTYLPHADLYSLLSKFYQITVLFMGQPSTAPVPIHLKNPSTLLSLVIRHKLKICQFFSVLYCFC